MEESTLPDCNVVVLEAPSKTKKHHKAIAHKERTSPKANPNPNPNLNPDINPNPNLNPNLNPNPNPNPNL